MLQNKNFFNLNDFDDVPRAAFYLGAVSASIGIFCVLFPIKFPIFFVSLPLFCSYLSYGSTGGLVSSSISIISALLFYPFASFCEIFLNIIAPAMLLGHFSTKSILNKKKKWWYPESFLLRDFALLSLFSVVFLSVTFCSEEAISKAYQDISYTLFKNEEIRSQFFQQYMKPLMNYSVGSVALIKMLASTMNFRIAHVLSKRWEKNIRPSFDFINISLPLWMALLPLISLTLSVGIPNLSFIFGGVFVVSLFAPIVNGLAIVHYYSKIKKRNAALIFTYAVLLLLPVMAFIAIIAIGIADTLLDLRSKV